MKIKEYLGDYVTPLIRIFIKSATALRNYNPIEDNSQILINKVWEIAVI